jgi:hypothetical protein
MSQKTQRKAARRQAGGALGRFSDGPTGPVAIGRGAVARANGTLGGALSLGGLGGNATLAGGFSAKPTRPGAAVGALGASGLAGKAPPSSLRPRPGRGANPVLALAGTNHYLARDRRR